MAAQYRLQDSLPPLLQHRKRSSLGSLHEARVNYHVGDNDGGEAALGAFIGIYLTSFPLITAQFQRVEP